MAKQHTTRPTSITPTVDREVGQARNIPGRGIVDHGVDLPADVEWNQELDVPDSPPLVHFEEIPMEPAPIPVYQVSGPGEGAVTHLFRTMYAIAGAALQPRMIAGQHQNRTKLSIRNTGDEVIYIGSEASVTDMYGWPINGGEILTLNTSRAVYAVVASSSATDSVPVSLLEEFDIQS